MSETPLPPETFSPSETPPIMDGLIKESNIDAVKAALLTLFNEGKFYNFYSKNDEDKKAELIDTTIQYLITSKTWDEYKRGNDSGFTPRMTDIVIKPVISRWLNLADTRKPSFEKSMRNLPNEIVDYISDYIPKKTNRNIAKTYFASPADKSVYTGIKDKRYDDLPEYQKDLAVKLSKLGTFEKVRETLNQWYSMDVDQNINNLIVKCHNCLEIDAIRKILENEKWKYIGGNRLTKMRTKRRISKNRNTKKRKSKK